MKNGDFKNIFSFFDYLTFSLFFMKGDEEIGVEWDPDLSSRPKPKWYRNLNKETIRNKQLNAAMDPNFDPEKLAAAGDKMQSGNKNRAVVQAIPTIAGGLSTDVTLTKRTAYVSKNL